MAEGLEAIRIELETERARQAETLLQAQHKLAQIDKALEALDQQMSSDGTAIPRQDFADMGITQATKRLFDANGNIPMGTGDIARAIRARGVVSKSKKFTPTVYATLANSDMFVRKHDKWSLKKPKGD